MKIVKSWQTSDQIKIKLLILYKSEIMIIYQVLVKKSSIHTMYN
jgi:hypothetical protein